MTFEALNEVVAVHDSSGKLRQHVVIRLDLAIQIAGDVREIIQGLANRFKRCIQIRIHVRDGSVGRG